MSDQKTPDKIKKNVEKHIEEIKQERVDIEASAINPQSLLNIQRKEKLSLENQILKRYRQSQTVDNILKPLVTSIVIIFLVSSFYYQISFLDKITQTTKSYLFEHSWRVLAIFASSFTIVLSFLIAGIFKIKKPPKEAREILSSISNKDQ